MGRSTCASASALSLDAQPAQLERLVNRICLPDGESEEFSINLLYSVEAVSDKLRMNDWYFKKKN
jgi:hypothetical protein